MKIESLAMQADFLYLMGTLLKRAVPILVTVDLCKDEFPAYALPLKEMETGMSSDESYTPGATFRKYRGSFHASIPARFNEAYEHGTLDEVCISLATDFERMVGIRPAEVQEHTSTEIEFYQYLISSINDGVDLTDAFLSAPLGHVPAAALADLSGSAHDGEQLLDSMIRHKEHLGPIVCNCVVEGGVLNVFGVALVDVVNYLRHRDVLKTRYARE